MEESIGTVLRRARRERGLKISEVAKATHTSPASFSVWENDKQVPSKRSLEKLGEFYHINLGDSEDGRTDLENQQTEAPIETLLAATTITYKGKTLSHSQQVQIHSFLSGFVAGKE